MIVEESPPRLRWRLPSSDYVLANAGLTDVKLGLATFGPAILPDGVIFGLLEENANVWVSTSNYLDRAFGCRLAKAKLPRRNATSRAVVGNAEYVNTTGAPATDNNKLELVVEVDVNKANASIKSINTSLSGMEEATDKATLGASAAIEWFDGEPSTSSTRPSIWICRFVC